MAGAGLAGLVPAAVLAELASGCSSPARKGAFDDHQFKVVREATARLIPGPEDDPAEAGHPGAREAGVANYISTLLGAMDHHPPVIFAGGPFSNRASSLTDEMADFLAPNPALLANWARRLKGLQTAYAEGIGALDRLAQGKGAKDFLHLDKARMDSVLTANPKVPSLPTGYVGFTDLLFEHAIEGMYSVPEYGGNHLQAGWEDIGFPGDVQPRGYTDEDVSSPLDTVPYTPTDAVAKVLGLLTSTAPK
ncbi:MAG TPA: gluconate 2-dehydrogenase subunit 3 family protein [Acidimicrobiales bacterium]|nr:gluconate 2-dehydrogenase subunit 3 family protein [Acidimicrobiales bacterium]